MSLMCVCVVFFFKQKTAYEMRISDWSSDVCSSDLVFQRPRQPVELPDGENIAGLETVEQSVEFRPIPAAARGVFLVDPGAACGFECFDLRGGILVFGLGHAGIAAQLG